MSTDVGQKWRSALPYGRCGSGRLYFTLHITSKNYCKLTETYRRRYGGRVKVILSCGSGSGWNYTSRSEQWTCLCSRLFQHQQSTVPQVVRLADVLDDTRLKWHRGRSTLKHGVDERAQCTWVAVFLHDVTAGADERTNHA